MAATAALLAAWCRQRADRALLVRVELTVPSARTLYLATRGDARSDATAPTRVWQGLLMDVEAIEAPGDFLSAGLDPCTFAFSLPIRSALNDPTAGTVGATFSGYRWVGAVVTVWAWERTLALFVPDALQVWKGVVDNFEATHETVRLQCVQRRTTNPQVTPRFVNRADDPRANDAVIGSAKPIIAGDCGMQPMRGPWNRENNSTPRRLWEIAGGAIAGSTAVLTDPGTGRNTILPKGRLVVACHALNQVTQGSGAVDELGVAIKGPDGLAQPIMIAAHGDVFNTATEAGVLLNDDQGAAGTTAVAVAHQRIPIQELNWQANQAENSELLLSDPTEYRSVVFDYTANKRSIEFRLGSVQRPGKATGLSLIFGYRTPDTTDQGQEFYVSNGTTLAIPLMNHTPQGGMPSGVLPTIVRLAPVAPGNLMYGTIMARTWDLSDLVFGFRFRTGTWTGKKFEVFFVSAVVTYRPTRRTLRTEKRMVARADLWSQTRSTTPSLSWGKTANPRGLVPVYTAITEQEGSYLANPLGYADDGSGTFTGVALALIERAPDHARYLLTTYGLISAGLIETGASVHGSFVDARAKLKTWTSQDMRYAREITETVGLHDVILDLAAQSASWFFLNRFTDKYAWVVWDPAATVSYAHAFSAAELTTFPVVGTVGAARVLTDLRIGYLRDAARNRDMGNVAAGPSHSQAGWLFMDIRDEYLTVVTGVNDKLDFNDGTARTVTLDPGDYTPATLAAHAMTKMNAISANYHVSYGADIVNNSNTTMDIHDGTTEILVMLPVFTHPTMESLATAVALAMNTAPSSGGGYSCSYSRTTRKFTLSKSSGTFQLRTRTGSNVPAGNLAWTTLGFSTLADHTGALTYVAEFEREEDRFSLGLNNTATAFSLTFKTGANGLDGTRTNVAELFGFLSLYDGTAQSSYMGDSPKGNREKTLAAAATAYSGKREVTLPGNWLRDTYTARELRNRLIALGAVNRLTVSFSTHRAVDLERGRVIEFAADLDLVLRYPKDGTDGSWVGKRFWVVETRQHVGPDRWDTEVFAVEA